MALGVGSTASITPCCVAVSTSDQDMETTLAPRASIAAMSTGMDCTRIFPPLMSAARQDRFGPAGFLAPGFTQE
ncbi:hypothetical protein [Palleronia aestuarii]|uniref:hypothetical protein n=1 Tax=Palleronia aestuarii TaxID=568105 RepID=UPI001F2BE165|nr:hypothetical protein [Palleronia aestuarii]